MLLVHTKMSISPSMREDHHQRREEDPQRACHVRQTPEENENSDDDQQIVDAADFGCPVRVAEGIPDRLAVADDRVPE